ncbi:hypothetical protein Glove_86g153 [Diversispora epigaea]|uniref:Uncharacterized protein n=1 Tax=Diversispora epigaea TaxID=1348612 RepID=A0A397JDJ4_9GLOM|nr:hypothetical protein Glove_86g153 [Diversispora epigaea]
MQLRTQEHDVIEWPYDRFRDIKQIVMVLFIMLSGFVNGGDIENQQCNLAIHLRTNGGETTFCGITRDLEI